MVAAPPPANEAERLRALQSYDILDSAPEAIFDAMTELAANMCDVPIALVTLVDEKRQWFKSNCGLSGAHETQRSVSFCAHAILGNEIFEVPDAAADPRFADNPLVTGEPHIRFYAGAPIRDEQGLALGTLCVVDRRPRLLTHAQRMTLERSAGALGGVIATRARRSLVDPAMLTFFDTALREANERAAHLDALQDLAHCLNDADPATILDIALEAAVPIRQAPSYRHPPANACQSSSRAARTPRSRIANVRYWISSPRWPDSSYRERPSRPSSRRPRHRSPPRPCSS
jgi:hypothetical protein